MQVPFLSFVPQHQLIREEVLAAVARVYDSQWYVLGESVTDFEQQFAAYCNVSHAVGVANGLDALHLSLKALDIKPGDEVIVPSNTYIATWLAVSYVGATVVPVEPNPTTYNLDPTQLETAITPRTRVILPVHLYGQACQMADIMDIANRYEINVIEDNAQAQGAICRGQRTGSFGQLNATSFYPGKNLGALGDAGAITTNNADLARKVQVMRNYGSQQKYYNEIIGHNSRLDELQAAVLSVKLKQLDYWTSQRQQIAGLYNQALEGVGDLKLPEIAKECTHVYHLYVVNTQSRDALHKWLQERSIGTLIHYPVPPHLQQAYSHLGFKAGQFPIAEASAKTVLSLPMWPGMTTEHVEYVVRAVKDFFAR
ncbi:DegT/DnrJ/EryC1/StrS family aminotransferase [Hymenobacter koreensis]|uniref:DegT/DnrJ/EryC1/StrS family aminotransferase n=1 Tax=Hymenobacter koreensis TaxID=1084523 RepID=A0ABP8ITX6_9BACT